MTGSDREPDLTDPWNVPPWELPGNCRADAAPHRGTLLRRLGNVGFFLAIASCYPCLSACVPLVWTDVVKDWLGCLLLFIPAAVLGLLAVIVSVTTASLAKNDLEVMRAGLVDPNGQWETEFARRRAAVGVVFGVASVLGWGILAVAGALGR